MKYRPVYTLFLSVILLTAGLSSCSYKHYKGFEQVSTENTPIPVVYVSSFTKAVYSTNFKIFGQELSGITMMKKVQSGNTIHVVFMSQIGLKFFDIEIRPEDKENWFHVNYIMESMNREFIISMLKTDFMLLFGQYPKHSEIAAFRQTGSNATETTIRFDKNVASVFSQPTNNQPVKIELRKGCSVKATIQLTPGNNYPENVEINNKRAGLQLEWDEIQM